MFYRALGLTLVSEKHGRGPKHYSMTVGTLVIELYPKPVVTEFTFTGTADVILGFAVESIVEAVLTLYREGFTVLPDISIEQGCRVATFRDPDGRQVRLTEAAATYQPASP